MRESLRYAQIYLSKDRHGIITPMFFNSEGIYYEQDEVLVIERWRGGGYLAQGLRDALERFKFREGNLRDRKKSDWPAFRASNRRSMREFEDEYLRISVQAQNTSELFYSAFAQPRGESDITLRAALNPYGTDEETVRLLLRLFDRCLNWPIDEP